MLQRALRDGVLPTHPPRSEANTGTWKVPPVPADLDGNGIAAPAIWTASTGKIVSLGDLNGDKCGVTSISGKRSSVARTDTQPNRPPGPCLPMARKQASAELPAP